MRLPLALLLLAALVAPASAAAAPTAISAALADAELELGDPARVVGRVEPAEAGVDVALERERPDGSWTRVARQTTVDGGTFAFRWRPELAGTLRVRTAGADGADVASAPLLLSLRPSILLPQPVRVAAFAPDRVVVRVRPRTYAGTVAVVLSQSGRVLRRIPAKARNGLVAVPVQVPVYGAFRIRVVMPAKDGLDRADIERRGIALPRDVASGSTGPEVAALVRRLAALRIFAPEPTETFDSHVYDSVVAFQKAYDLERTGAVDAAVWRRLFASQPLRPARKAPATHIEVDIDRQVLVKVIDGQVARVIPISSGATGNTPRGTFQVLRKDVATTSLWGGLLYNVLTYHGNFAIHGYPDVPPWPASHGCTRVPEWIAPWLWEHSEAGETVYNL